MKLILSSCDFRNENSRRVILENLPKPIENCRLLFIPNEKQSPRKLKSGIYHERMENFGFSKENIAVFDYKHPDRFYNLDIDVLFISGGNTCKTLYRIRSHNFDGEIVRYIKSGVTYIGGSAGAHIISADVSHVKRYDEPQEVMTDFSGLGLYDGIFICHYSPERRAHYEELQSEGKYKVTALTNDDSVVIEKE